MVVELFNWIKQEDRSCTGVSPSVGSGDSTHFVPIVASVMKPAADAHTLRNPEVYVFKIASLPAPMILAVILGTFRSSVLFFAMSSVTNWATELDGRPASIAALLTFSPI